MTQSAQSAIVSVVKVEPSGFLDCLVAAGEVRLGSGPRVRARRWANQLYTQVRFHEQGSLAWRMFFFTACLIAGPLAQFYDERASKSVTVTGVEGRSGLDLRPLPEGSCAHWRIVGLWAWPLGHERGRALLHTVLDAAERADVVLQLQAGNQRLAETLYAPLGFVVQTGDETAKRPWIVRHPNRRAQGQAALARVRDFASS